MRYEVLAMAALLAALSPTAIVAEPLASPSAPALDAGLLQLMGDFGRAARAVQRQAPQDGSQVNYRFSDGTRLIVRRTASAPGKVSVNGLVGSGRLGMPETLARSAWGMAFLPLGGTNSASYEEIEQWLAASGHSVELNVNPELRAFRFWGTAASLDVGYQIALLCGIVRHPGMREVVSRKAAEFGSTLALQIEMKPDLVLARAINRAASGLGARYDELPLREEISQHISEDLQAIAERELTGPADLAVVGDVDPDVAAAYVATTCAAGGHSAPPRKFPALVAHFEAGEQRWTFIQPENSPSGIEAFMWPIAQKEERHREALDLLADVLRVRLSMRLSSPQHRVVPIVSAAQGFTGDRFGFFAAAFDHSDHDDVKAADLIKQELRALVDDPTLGAQLSAVWQQRQKGREMHPPNNQQWAAALAEGLSNAEAVIRFEQPSGSASQPKTKDIKAVALALLGTDQSAKIALRPRD
jgi:hypothetical protein